jgi:hypothetical protein
VRPGLVVLSFGTLLDGVYHAAPDAAVGQWLGPEGFHAHLVIFVGMLLVLGHVLRQGLRAPRRTTPSE